MRALGRPVTAFAYPYGEAVWRLVRQVCVVLYWSVCLPSLVFAADPRWQRQPLATQEIRYRMPEADEVFLVWWFNDGLIVPPELHPPGSKMQAGALVTPMEHVRGTFIATLQAPPGLVIGYCFLITRARNGAAVNLWDTNGSPLRSYTTIVMPRGVTEVLAKVTLHQEQVFASRSGTPWVTQEIRYYVSEADEVFLVWGYNGWLTLPEGLRPQGTVVKKAVMHTAMARSDGFFVTKVQIPVGSVMQYGLQVTKNRDGVLSHVWEDDGYRDYLIIALQDGVVEVRAKPVPVQTPPVVAAPNPGLLLLPGLGILVGLTAVFKYISRSRYRRHHY